MNHTVKPRTASYGTLFLALAIVAVAGIALAIYLDNKAASARLAEHCATPSAGVFSSKLGCVARPVDR